MDLKKKPNKKNCILREPHTKYVFFSGQTTESGGGGQPAEPLRKTKNIKQVREAAEKKIMAGPFRQGCILFRIPPGGMI